MKFKNTLFLFIAIFSLTSSFAQKNNIKKDMKMYSKLWDNIINKGEIALISDLYFSKDITLIISPESIVGLENVKTHYQHFLTGFSEIDFTIVDLFGQDNKIMKHWNFKGRHTGDFFGIPATGKSVDIDGVTLVKMQNGKIAQEQDFMDNLTFMNQLGINPFAISDNSNVIQGLYDDFKTGNIPGISAAMDANIVWNEAENFPLADGNPYIGFDAIASGVFGRIMEDWEYWNLADVKLHSVNDNMVLATGRYNAKYKKNGAEINLQMAHLWTLKDGKIVAFQQFADTKGIHDAMNE
ncbi:nuclear transport factor 2 family protein [uncultured Algibacter sp.]|uniref:nuclear transport factor 2 family protein n=1 Tax=uncultured Algibacter sp. TaxID=298659 RepID=UPI002633756B|nr:nuclear transport factor 2 family protein [uncultured Algibacter sp.]